MKDLESFEALLLVSWMAYQGSGTSYGDDFNGFMEWLKDRKAKKL